MVSEPSNLTHHYHTSLPEAIGPVHELEREGEVRPSACINGETEGLWLVAGTQELDPI